MVQIRLGPGRAVPAHGAALTSHVWKDHCEFPNDKGFDEWYGIPRTTDEE
jgi:hypothetical protein